MNFIEIKGVGLRYELSGQGDRTIVLVHEMGGSLDSWDEVAPKLARDRRVLRYDARGAGMSSKLRVPPTVDMMADDIAALLDALTIKGKVALAGIAVGGGIALHFASRHAARTSAVVVGSPATSVAMDRRAFVLEKITQIESNGMLAAVDESMQNGYAQELRDNDARFRGFRARWLGNDPISYGAIYRMLTTMDVESGLKKIACPVLVIGAELDRVRPAALAEGTAKLVANARFRPLRTGHYMAVQTPDLIAATISEFLASANA